MKHKIEIWIDKFTKNMEVYIEEINNPNQWELIQPCINLEDEIQLDEFIKMFTFLGYDVVVKELEEED